MNRHGHDCCWLYMICKTRRASGLHVRGCPDPSPARGGDDRGAGAAGPGSMSLGWPWRPRRSKPPERVKLGLACNEDVQTHFKYDRHNAGGARGARLTHHKVNIYYCSIHAIEWDLKAWSVGQVLRRPHRLGSNVSHVPRAAQLHVYDTLVHCHSFLASIPLLWASSTRHLYFHLLAFAWPMADRPADIARTLLFHVARHMLEAPHHTRTRRTSCPPLQLRPPPHTRSDTTTHLALTGTRPDTLRRAPQQRHRTPRPSSSPSQETKTKRERRLQPALLLSARAHSRSPR